MALNQHDLEQIRMKGIPESLIREQLERFENGFPYADVVRPATPDDGILCLSETEQKNYRDYFDQHTGKRNIMRFVPASGAATRMFRDIFAARDKLTENPEYTLSGEAYRFFENLRKFAFYDALKEAMESHGVSPADIPAGKNRLTVLDFFLEKKGLGYGEKPKGQILFHKYPDKARTAFEEHLVEAAGYARQENGEVHNHFTVSPQHRKGFEEILALVQQTWEKRNDVRYITTFSVQKPSTDTIAVDPDNRPCRLEDGSILFRPGGHGALIENLNDLDADIIFIKNIDNVTQDHFRSETLVWKRILGGVLLDRIDTVFYYQKMLDTDSYLEDDLRKMISFAREKLHMDTDGDSAGPEQLRNIFFRPVRVCGMVRNEGEPGGGPFWLKGKDGKVSLQIVESAQIDTDNPVKNKIMEASTHFNPVDIVCSVKDYRGIKYDLRNFTDPETGFISYKSYGERPLKALELPGLWNGGMAGWITLFVEVPASTFTPVKTVNDLLRREHQPA